MSRLIVSLGQMDVKLGETQANWDQVASWTAEAARRGSHLVLFPELWSTGYDLERWEQHASGLQAGLFLDLASLANRHQITIGGSILEYRDARAFNTFTLHGPDGDLVALYRKVHLFRLMQEDQWLAPGEELTLVKTAWGTSGLAICYDLRFPEVFRTYALGGAQLVLLVAEWPKLRIDHWRVLLRARAIENQLFIAAVNRVGISREEHFGGFSAVINPWGETIIEAGADQTLLTVEIDLGEVEHIRARIPVFKDRRPDLYG